MKNLIITLAVIIVAAVVAVIVLKPKPPLKEAHIAETRGEYQKAIDLYVAALREATEGMKLVDKNRAKLVKPQEWFGEVRAYMEFAAAPSGVASPEVSKIITALSRCTSFVEQTQYTTDDSTHAYSDTAEFELAADWRRAFFPKGVTVKGDHSPLMKEAFNRGLSILRITSMRSYTYEGILLDLSSWKRVDFMLYPEDEVSFLVKGGRYLLITKGEVEFPNGTIWRSPQNLMEVETPDSSCLKTFILKTKVTRG